MSYRKRIELLENEVKRMNEQLAKDVIYAPWWECDTWDITLNGKVNAIIEHLGLEVSVQPKKITDAKVKVTKKPQVKKK